ncbi:MAG: hypothetical protein ACP5M1_13215, partial [Acidiphilium sp.]
LGIGNGSSLIIPCLPVRFHIPYTNFCFFFQFFSNTAKGGVSSYLSPHVILGGMNIDYNKHCQVPFGAYVQAVQENNPNDTNALRTIDAIYLPPMDNIQGRHELMDLNSGHLITCPRVFEIPSTCWKKYKKRKVTVLYMNLNQRTQRVTRQDLEFGFFRCRAMTLRFPLSSHFL